MKKVLLLLSISILFSCLTNPGQSDGAGSVTTALPPPQQTEEKQNEVKQNEVVNNPVIAEDPIQLKENALQEENTVQPEPLVEKNLPVIYPQLSKREIENIILDTIPESFIPVTNEDSHIKIIYGDLDQNGYKDAFLLVVNNRENLDAGFKNLSDVSRLLDNEQNPIDFFLSVYLQLQGTMISMFRIPIGSGTVISDFSIVSIKHETALPLGINISFQTTKGIEREWIVFSKYNRFSLFSMKQNISAYSNILDIDQDGLIDIIEWKDGLEEGTGYETYLTWYRWNGREYREYLATNIVRNLNVFLEQTRLFLSFEQMDDFFRHSLNIVDYMEYKKSGEDSYHWLMKIFRIVPGSPASENELEECSNFRSIVFPQVFENPYSPRSSTLHIFNINVRFVCADGYSFIRTARIQMNSNPFSKPQFSFYLE